MLLAGFAFPILAGIGWMLAQGAPLHYVAINGASLAIIALWILFGRAPASDRVLEILAATLIALLFLPLLTGPDVNAIRRWLPLGPIVIHSGLLVIPLLVILLSRFTPIKMLVGYGLALAAALLQPDAAIALALGGALLAQALDRRNVDAGLFAIPALLIALYAASRGNIAPVSFVERVVSDAFGASILWGMMALLSLIAAIVIVARMSPMHRPARLALAGSLAGFAFISVVAYYPVPLLGYGAAAILGYGLALGWRENHDGEPDRRTDGD